MNIYFSGIGGVGIGPLAEIAQDAGYQVQGSDMNESPLTKKLQERGVAISIGQDGSFLQTCHDTQPIDWFVHTSALPENHPELILARQLGIKTAKRDELIAHIVSEKNLKLIAVAGTHGKTTVTGMLVWSFQQLGIPVSYSVGTTLSFGASGKFDPKSEYFIYECDEFDRNFLHFSPYLSLITSLDYDHPDTYPTKSDYISAFRQFIAGSRTTIMWHSDNADVQATAENGWILGDNEVLDIHLAGAHNRRNTTLVAKALENLSLSSTENAKLVLEAFPGTHRRFEKLATNLYSDYGHHPVEIAATLQLARELSDHVVLVYQPHQNVRQHEIRADYTNCFEQAESIYWLPTYLSREDPNLPILSPEELSEHVTNKSDVHVTMLGDNLWNTIQKARDEGKLVLVMGAGTIDAWTRQQLQTLTIVNILVSDKTGKLIMQKRDDKPGISNPGMITGFGGHVDPEDISLRAAAARELHEETNVSFSSEKLRYFHTYHKTPEIHGEDSYVTYYTLDSMDTADLEIYEGQGFALLDPQSDLSAVNLSPLVRQAIADYRKHHGD